MGSFKRPIVQNLQRVDAVDLNRAGQYGSRALQEVLRGLANGANGVASTTALLISAAGAGSFDVVAAPGLAFYYDATGLGADESAYRVIETYAHTVISMGGAPPAAGTYYVHVRWASTNGQSEPREKRAAAGAPFAPAACDTAHLSAPVFLVDPAPVVAGHLNLASVVVPGGAVDSTAYTITDRRPMVFPPRYVYQHMTAPLIPAGSGIGYVGVGTGTLAAVADGTVEYIIPEPSDLRLLQVYVWAEVVGGAAACLATLSRLSYSTGAATVLSTGPLTTGAGVHKNSFLSGTHAFSVEDRQHVLELAFTAGGGSLLVGGVYARYERRMYNVP